MRSYCDVTNSVYTVTMTTAGHCSIQVLAGVYSQAVAPGITRPLHATELRAASLATVTFIVCRILTLILALRFNKKNNSWPNQV